jgi:hypothetical protein
MMNSILRILKPSALAGILLLVILLVQGACFTSGSMTYSMGNDKPDKTQSSYGVGAPITVTNVNGVTSCDINGPILLANLAFSYLLAAVLARAFARATRFRRPATAYAMVAIIMVLISFLVSIGFSRSYWGYFFARPSVLPEVSNVASVSAVIPITTVADDDGTRRIVVQNDYSITDRVAYGRKDQYYCLSQRVLLALDDAGLLPPTHSVELTDLPILFPLIQATGILAEHEEGLSGVVVDTLNQSGNRLVFIGVSGRQFSNDHYPYYEMVFTGSAGSPSLSYVHGQRFFYDVAGIEGGEWYLVWPFLALVGVVIAFVAVTVAILIWRLVGRTQKAQQSAAPLPSASQAGPSEGAR